MTGTGISASGPRLHSKVLCWAALDKGVKIAEENVRCAHRPLAGGARYDHEVILEEGFDDDLNCFTQTFAGGTVDAAALRIGGVGFLPFDDDRLQATIDAVMDHLMTEDGLVWRYEGDDACPARKGRSCCVRSG